MNAGSTTLLCSLAVGLLPFLCLLSIALSSGRTAKEAARIRKLLESSLPR